MNGNSEVRQGNAYNCVAIAVDDLKIPGVLLDVPPIPFYALIGALSHHCTIVKVQFPPGTSVKDFWRTHPTGKFLLCFSNPPHDDGTPADLHVCALTDGNLHNCTEVLLHQPLIEAQQFL